MPRHMRTIVLFLAVMILVGCGKKEAAIPTKLDQPIPKVAGSGGQGGEEKKNKNAQPNKAAD